MSISYSENYRDLNNKINYADKYHLNYVYQCEKECKFDKKLSNFLGDGGDIVDISNNKTLYVFPYAIANNVKKDLNSNFFKDWINNKLKNGIIINKTEIYSDPGIDSKKLGYIIPGDKFNIVDVTSRWLKISYKAKNKKAIIGWINCESTNVCS